MQSKAKTVAAYLAELPPDRRAALAAIRKVILANIDPAFEECMGYGMMGWAVPHSVYPPGYHCDPKQPLPFAGLASQKNYMSLYMMSLYGADEAWFASAWKKTGRKLDMGKCCIRFRKLEDVALDVVAEAFRRTTAKDYIAHYEANIRTRRKAKTAAAPGKASPAGRAARAGAAKRSRARR